MTARQMTIVRAPSTNNTPMLRIVNKTLRAMGFDIGTAVAVSYRPGVIVIKKVTKVTKDHGNNI